MNQFASEPEVSEALKAWRIGIARQENVPVFVVLHDSVLREIARSKPDNKVALAVISGIGESKFLRFGEGVLERVGAEIGWRESRYESRGDATCVFSHQERPSDTYLP